MQNLIEKEIIRKVKEMTIQDKINIYNLIKLAKLGEKEQNINKKEELIKLAGSWSDSRTAEEIIIDIHNSRQSTHRTENLF